MRLAAFDLIRGRKIIAIDGIAELGLPPVFKCRPGVAEAVFHDEKLQLLAESIQALPERGHCMLTLLNLPGLSRREMARKPGVSESTANVQGAIGVLRLFDYLYARNATKGGEP